MWRFSVLWTGFLRECPNLRLLVVLDPGGFGICTILLTGYISARLGRKGGVQCQHRLHNSCTTAH